MKGDSAACGCGNANQFRGDICTTFPRVSLLDLFMQLKRQSGSLTYRYVSMLHTHNRVSLSYIFLLFSYYFKKALVIYCTGNIKRDSSSHSIS